ncbi:ShlB/FhaC/HecB family hemolysin secretion/activation protein [Microbulbifer pacificus]|uniref:ShlB/FhaC/HecB family hemolysin secretion/activation protein n=1 Tax=Microbulbifer pacificus TaxID=407164 RepID=UPI000CF513E0|nr:ShlB/FhaC/HecB family hemolysin secretion/activation protein [Microbulbifer pacificus]
MCQFFFADNSQESLGLVRNTGIRVFFLSCFAFSDYAMAQVGEAERRRDLFEKRELQKRIEEFQGRERERVIEDDSVVAEGRHVDISSESRFLIRKIEIVRDGTPLSLDESKIITPYVGIELGVSEIFSLVENLTNYYVENGYSTTLVKVNPQNLSSGTLTLEVSWGRIEGVLLNGESPSFIRDRLSLFSAYPWAQEKKLNIHDVDQMVENLSTKGKSVNVKVIPSERDGYSYLNVRREKLRPWAFILGADNSGDKETGEYQHNVSLAMSDAMGVNDTLSLYLARQDYKDSDTYLREIYDLGYSLPVGFWKLSLKGNFSKTQTPVGDYSSEGESEKLSVGLERVFRRGQSGKWSVFGGIDKKRTENIFIIDDDTEIILDDSSNAFTHLSLGGRYVGRALGGFLYGDLSIVQGASWFNADIDVGRGQDDSGQAGFRKYKGNFNWSWNAARSPIEYRLSAGWQYSPDRLLAQDSLILGDEYTVRGFKGASMSIEGDLGGYLSNTVSFSLPVGKKYLNQVSPFIGADIGWARKHRRGSVGAEVRKIAGATLGLKIDGANYQFSSTFGFPVSNPNDFDPGYVLYMDVGMSF